MYTVIWNEKQNKSKIENMIALLMRVGSEVARLCLTLLRYKKVSKNEKSKIVMSPLRNYIFAILNKLLKSQLRSIFQKAAALTSKSVTFSKVSFLSASCSPILALLLSMATFF